MAETVVHYRRESGDMVAACNQPIGDLSDGEWSNRGDDVSGCPACWRALGNTSPISPCEHEQGCECFGHGYRAGWDYIVNEMIWAAEQDPEGCCCYGCMQLRLLGPSPFFKRNPTV